MVIYDVFFVLLNYEYMHVAQKRVIIRTNIINSVMTTVHKETRTQNLVVEPPLLRPQWFI